MSKNKKEKVNKSQKHYDKGQVFVKVMAGILAALMLLAACGTLIYCLLG